jgi:cell fate regulator YaaT (PSP1 superfamily)
MPDVVSVRFKPVTKSYYFDPRSLSGLQVDDRVIVETSRGVEMGTVAEPAHAVPKGQIKGKLKWIIRKATPVDLLEAERYRIKEGEARELCHKLVKKMGIPIKVISADYNFDGSRLLFSFTSEQRVDFRDLVKELTRNLRTRIEMKQVGARDETKLMDGYGRCGRRLCCSSWLTEFHPVSIKMAKQQNLPLAPSEISGLCGRLLCCLAYENETYVEMKKVLPKVGSQVETEEGVLAIVRGVNVIKETVLLILEGGDSYVEVEASLVKPPQERKTPPHGSPQEETIDRTDDQPQPRSGRRNRRRRRSRGSSS